MGFDIECIIDIHTYPGEYFCPVCRTLVYPKEALQSRCTHLYCKACLAHVANTTKACPYDGYLVTESDSKPLLDSDKDLSEKIGRVKVHCLYFRSGCTWEGTFSDCISHCSDCSFGNSPVICNRCSVHIMHRQVHDHAQICPGAYEGQQAASTAASTGGTQTIAPTSQGQNPQNANTVSLTAQTPNAQVNAGAQPSVAVPTQEQWHQQQYQQYYQQFPGYDLYQQQASQNYYAVQQQPLQQQYQHQAHVQSKAMPQPSVPPQPMSQPIPVQPQLQFVPQAQTQVQVPIPATNYQVHKQTMPPPPPHSQPIQPPPFEHPLGMRPAAQHPQMPQYQQPHVQMHHSQAQVQPQLHPQPQAQSHFRPPPNQTYLQNQPQVIAYHHTQTQPPMSQPQVQQFATPGAQLQAPHLPLTPVSGHQSYSRPPLAPQMQPAVMQQNQLQSNLGNIQGQAPPQQPPLVRSSYSHSSMQHQHPSMLPPPQIQAPGISTPPTQQYPPTRPGLPMQPPVQQAVPQQYVQLQPFTAPFQSQSHQQGHFPPQHTMPPHLPPYVVPQNQQSQNHPVRSTTPNQPMHPQNHALQSGGFSVGSNPVPAQSCSAQTALNQNYAKSIVPDINANMQAPLLPSKEMADNGIKGVAQNEDVATTVNETHAKDTDNVAENGVVISRVKQEDGDVHGSVVQVPNGKSFVDDATKMEFREEGPSLQNSSPYKNIKFENPITANIEKQSGSAVFGLDHGQSLDTREEREHGLLAPPPLSYDSQAVAQGPADKHSIMGRVPPRDTSGDQISCSTNRGNLVKTYSEKPNLYRLNGGKDEDSMFNSRDEKGKDFARERLTPFPAEPARDVERGPFSLRASHVSGYEAGFKLDPSVQSSRYLHPHRVAGHGPGPLFEQESEFGQHLTKHFVSRSPGREYLGSSPRRFGGPSDFSHDSAFEDVNSRIHPLPGHMPRGDIDGPGTQRFYGQGGPTHLRRTAYMGSGYFPGKFNVGESAGAGAFPGHSNLPHIPFDDTMRGDRSGFPHFGEPSMENSNFPPGLPHAWTSTGSRDPFEQSRRRLMSSGWCRICELDCEAVEGLDLHSQTREHQHMAMDIVNTIKMQNNKRLRTSIGHMGHEGGSRVRKRKNVGRGGSRT